MTDIGWSVERMRAAAREADREDQLDLHGFIGGEVTGGVAVRVISRVGRTFRDSVFLEFDHPYPHFDQIPGEQVEVSRSPFVVTSDPCDRDNRGQGTRNSSDWVILQRPASGLAMNRWTHPTLTHREKP